MVHKTIRSDPSARCGPKTITNEKRFCSKKEGMPESTAGMALALQMGLISSTPFGSLSNVGSDPKTKKEGDSQTLLDASGELFLALTHKFCPLMPFASWGYSAPVEHALFFCPMGCFSKTVSSAPTFLLGPTGHLTTSACQSHSTPPTQAQFSQLI